jgi:hypothetical protein
VAQLLYPQAAEIVSVTAIQLPFKTASVGLFKETIAFGPFLAEADLVAIEANFTGYTRKTLTTLPAAFPDQQNGGASFVLPTQSFAVGSTPTVFNDIYGGWMEDSSANLLFAFQLATPWPMNEALVALNLDALFNFFGNNLTLGTVTINNILQ